MAANVLNSSIIKLEFHVKYDAFFIEFLTCLSVIVYFLAC
jgi:hypothetical protein